MSQERSKGRILVIDDDLGMQSLLTDVLASQGYSVTGFPDAIGALKLISDGGQKIAAVICDLNMPRVSGMEFLNILAKMNAKIPVILITAFGTARTAQDAKKNGAFGYLSKPFPLSEINELLQKALSSPTPGNAA